jgi:hypothetical protein
MSTVDWLIAIVAVWVPAAFVAGLYLGPWLSDRKDTER